MNLTNYHSHCDFCDGKAPLESFIQEAITQGFTSYGISSHAPLPFATHWSMNWDQMPDYLALAQELKKKYADKIELYIGLEIDYLNEQSNPNIARFRELPLDYRIGSVHLLTDDKGEVVDIDVCADKFKAIVNERFNGNLTRVVELYYWRIMRMMELGGFDIIGHADKLHFNAEAYQPGLLDEAWYDGLMNIYFGAIARSGYMVEINTKALFKLGTFFPNERYFKRLKDFGIKVLVNSDAHFPEKVNEGRYEGLSALWEAGHREVMEIHNDRWVAVPIKL